MSFLAGMHCGRHCLLALSVGLLRLVPCFLSNLNLFQTVHNQCALFTDVYRCKSLKFLIVIKGSY